MAKKNTRRARSTRRSKWRRDRHRSSVKWTPAKGITSSGLRSFYTCPEQFALAYIDGKRPKTFSPEMEYGNLHHLCEQLQATLSSPPYRLSPREINQELARCTQEYCEQKSKRVNAVDLEALWTIRLVVLAMFQVYVRHYQDKHVEWYRREHAFRVKHPIGIQLRGKRDGEYWITLNNVKGLGLWETKTKSRIDVKHLQDQLACDDQSLFYLYAMHLEYKSKNLPAPPIHETYNVLKRPQYRRNKNETAEAYATRCAKAASDEPYNYFYRCAFSVQPHQLERYDELYLTPQLRNFLRWWSDLPGPSEEERRSAPYHYRNLSALVHPYGKSSFYDAIVHQRADSLVTLRSPFPELASDKIFERACKRHRPC